MHGDDDHDDDGSDCGSVHDHDDDSSSDYYGTSWFKLNGPYFLSAANDAGNAGYSNVTHQALDIIPTAMNSGRR